MEDLIQLSFNKFANTEFNLELFEIIAQLWETDSSWTEFRDKPRFGSGLVAIVEDMKVRYTNNDGEVFYAGQGDIIYVPYKGRYIFEVLSCRKDKSIKSVTINFNMVGKNGEIFTLADRPIKVAEEHPELASRIVAAHSSHTIRNYSKTYSIIYEVLNSITNINLNMSTSYYLIKKGLKALQNDFDKTITTAELASLCSLSESHFRKMFKEHTGMTPIEYRNRMRINYARDLMANNTVSVATAAAAVGITDQFYFSRLFKAIEGVSPMEFKKSRML